MACQNANHGRPTQAALDHELARLLAALKASEELKRSYFDELERLRASNAELLEALQRLLVQAGEGSQRGRAIDLLPRETLDQARAAIAKFSSAR
jgi:hypothetical protein